MAKILTTASAVECTHKGTVSLTGTSKLVVANAKAILKSETSGWSVSGCTTPNDTSKSLATCTKVSSISTGEAKKLSVGGVAVMLDSLGGMTDGKPVATVSATANQTKLNAS